MLIWFLATAFATFKDKDVILPLLLRPEVVLVALIKAFWIIHSRVLFTVVIRIQILEANCCQKKLVVYFLTLANGQLCHVSFFFSCQLE